MTGTARPRPPGENRPETRERVSACACCDAADGGSTPRSWHRSARRARRHGDGLLLRRLLADDRRAYPRGDCSAPIRACSPGRSSCSAVSRVTPRQLVDRLNDLGYSHRERAEEPGQFTVGRNALVHHPARRRSQGRSRARRLCARAGKTAEPLGIERLELPATKKTTNAVRLDAPLITALITTGRTKRRDVPLQVIPTKMVQAVLAIEDRRFYDHPGVDPIGILASFWNTSSAPRRTCAAAAPSPSSSSRTRS